MGSGLNKCNRGFWLLVATWNFEKYIKVTNVKVRQRALKNPPTFVEKIIPDKDLVDAFQIIFKESRCYHVDYNKEELVPKTSRTYHRPSSQIWREGDGGPGGGG